MCCWLSAWGPTENDNKDDDEEEEEEDDDDDNDDAASTSTVYTDAATADAGAICLRTSQFSYEKSKAGLPVCFLFGRCSPRRKVDVCLGRPGKTKISRVAFALGLKHDNWAVRNLGNSDVRVHRETLPAPGAPSYAFWAGRPNVVRVADMEQEFYGRESRDAVTYLTDDRYLPLTTPSSRSESSGASLTTTAHDQPAGVLSPLPDRPYVFQDQKIPNSDAAKEYEISKAQKEILEGRLALLGRLPLDGPFLRDETLLDRGNVSYLRSRFIEDIFPLLDCRDLATLRSARHLLRELLRIVALLHNHNVVHNDICLSTVFVAGTLDPESRLDNILLAGFSEATADMNRVKNDCYQVFQTVRAFLGEDACASLPKFWTGDEHLDRLWRQLPGSGTDSWPCSVQEACDLSSISHLSNKGEPRTITVFRGFNFKYSSQQDVSYLAADDVKKYLSKDAVRCAGKAATSYQVQSLLQKALVALQPCIRDGQVTVEDCSQFREHIKERHSDYDLGLRLFMSLPHKYYIKQPIRFTLSFPVPYLSRYGLINFEYLRRLASTGFNPDALKSLLPRCYEVRGLPEVRGVYVSISHLDVIAERLGHRVEDEYVTEPVDVSLEEYTYQNWYLLLPNSVSRMFPVSRTSHQVLVSHAPPTYTPLRTFLEGHFEAKTYLDSQVVHDPEKLFTADEGADKPPSHSCEGSVEIASEDSLLLRFRFSYRPKPSLLLEHKGKRRAEETSAWIREQEEERRLRRLSTGNRADITPTRFMKKSATK